MQALPSRRESLALDLSLHLDNFLLNLSTINTIMNAMELLLMDHVRFLAVLPLLLIPAMEIPNSGAI